MGLTVAEVHNVRCVGVMEAELMNKGRMAGRCEGKITVTLIDTSMIFGPFLCPFIVMQ